MNRMMRISEVTAFRDRGGMIIEKIDVAGFRQKIVHLKKLNVMEGKILGITLSGLGFLGLLVAIFYMNTVENSWAVNVLLGCGFFGAVLFFAGIWLLPVRRASAPAPGKAAKASRVNKNSP